MTIKLQDAEFMRVALGEARKGLGRTAPNPCVGAVVVRENRIVGRGYHRRAGTPHAEVNALADSGIHALGATLYVTLEPCNHTGRTPPCTQAILKAGISRVVVGMADPNPTVAGGGSAYLASQGIEVENGVLESECIALNRPFIKHITTGLPWVAMKAGMSLDGRISYGPGEGGRITGDAAKLYTHRLRNSLDAILIGINTALVDNPSLTTRLPAEEEGRDPLRVILDTHLRLPPDARLLQQKSEAATWVFCRDDASKESEERLVAAGAVVHRMPSLVEGRIPCRDVLDYLGRQGVTSVLVEGGAAVHGAMLQAKLVDEVFLFIAPMFIGQQGVPVVAASSQHSSHTFPRLHNIELTRLDEDVLLRGLFSTM